MKRIGNAIGKNADKIDEESWKMVMNELNMISSDCAKELQSETGWKYPKYYTDGTHAYDLGLEQAPPTRLLALELVVASFLGWFRQERYKANMATAAPPAAWFKLIEDAYEYGVNLSSSGRSS